MRRTEERSVPSTVYVFYCDRCGKEIPSTKSLSTNTHVPVEGAKIDSRLEDDWAPLIAAEGGDYTDTGTLAADRSRVDLCADCLKSLRVWMGPGKAPPRSA